MHIPDKDMMIQPSSSPSHIKAQHDFDQLIVSSNEDYASEEGCDSSLLVSPGESMTNQEPAQEDRSDLNYVQNYVQAMRVEAGGHANIFLASERHVSPWDRFFGARNAFIDVSLLQMGKRIGKGAVAQVFKARFGTSKVAVKRPRADSKYEAARSCAVLADELQVVVQGLNHPNITKFVGCSIQFYSHCPPLPLLVYEYLSGGSAEAALSKKNMFGRTWKPARSLSLSWSRQLASAVAFLHSLEEGAVAHRDIKPENLLLSKDWRILKLADFSASAPAGLLTPDSPAAAPAVVGSLRYMAPEVSEVDPFQLAPTDVYSAALSVYFLLYQRRPFDEFSPLQARARALAGFRPHVPSADRRVADILTAAWKPQPELRPSASAFEAQLKELQVVA